jgi:hypothetical protein
MWQVFFPLQTLHVFFFLSQNLQIFGLALRKKAQYVVVNGMIQNDLSKMAPWSSWTRAIWGTF